MAWPVSPAGTVQTTGDHAFSVAQHSVLVVDIVRGLEPEAERTPAAGSTAARCAGIRHRRHDFAVQGRAGQEYGAVETRLMAAIHLRFGLPARVSGSIRKSIKTADRISAHREAVDLAGFSAAEARKLFPLPEGAVASATPLVPQPAVDAQKAFLAAFEALRL